MEKLIKNPTHRSFRKVLEIIDEKDDVSSILDKFEDFLECPVYKGRLLPFNFAKKLKKRFLSNAIKDKVTRKKILAYLDKWTLGRPRYKLRPWLEDHLSDGDFYQWGRIPEGIDLLEDHIRNEVEGKNYPRRNADIRLSRSKLSSANPNGTGMISIIGPTEYMYENPMALSYIEKEIKKGPSPFYLYGLSSNPAAKEMLLREVSLYPDNANWINLATNPAAIDLFQDKSEQDEFWEHIVENPAAAHIIESRLHEKPLPDNLWKNPSLRELILTMKDKIKLEYIVQNPAMMDFIRENLDKILRNRKAKINLLLNPAAGDLIEEIHETRPEVFEDEHLPISSASFILDYQRMKKEAIASGFKEELARKACSPERIQKIILMEQERLQSLGRDIESYDILDLI